MVWCLVKHRDNFTFTFPQKVAVEILVFLFRIRDVSAWRTAILIGDVRGLPQSLQENMGMDY
jgi:hypothetical protein